MPVKWNTTEMIRRARQGAVKGLAVAAEVVREEAISLILETEKTGRIYKRRTVLHQASAPGEPPASDTGRLANSIRIEPSPANLTARVIAQVSGGTDYAARLEYGTVKMAARPYMRPALRNKHLQVEQIIAGHVRTALK